MKHCKAAYVLLIFILLNGGGLFCQNEATKWCFGNGAGLDFMTNPPSPFTTSMNVNEGCSSIADPAGNLLFYTNGVSVWNQQHQLMAGGTGLAAGTALAQNVVIVKQPGNSNIYFIFTISLANGIYYSTVDMNLAAGMGSVTSLNALLPTPNNSNLAYYYTNRLSATRHCNGTDIWVVAREDYWNVNNPLPNSFYSFLVTGAGVNTVAVVSAAGTNTTFNANGWTNGCMKISPNGTKIGLASSRDWNPILSFATDEFEVWDFNSSTGAVTNSVGLSLNNVLNNNSWHSGYSCEFSPDGSKFYGSNILWYGTINYNLSIGQWDLCAGSATAIAASMYNVEQSINIYADFFYSMQLAPNGKIYIAPGPGYYSLHVIDNPNVGGVGCGFTAYAQTTGTRPCRLGLPNLMTSYVAEPPPPFTSTTSCFTTSFTAPTPTIACSAVGYSVSSISWNFGDPASGAANTSTIANPTHVYPTFGTYTTVLTFFKACATMTIALPITINAATLAISSSSVTCGSLGSGTATAMGGVGPFSYTWMPTAQTNSIATGLIPGSYSISIIDNGNNCTYTATNTFLPLVPLTGTLSNSSSIPCNGVGSATAAIPLSGGSGNSYYSWSNGVAVQTSSTASNLTAGFYTVNVLDALTSCSVTNTFTITQPPALTLAIVASNATACAGTSLTFTATASGGSPGPLPGYTYSWTNGQTTDTRTATQALSGNYSYSVSARDGNNCVVTNWIAATFIPNPTITISSVSICPQQTATLIPSGATIYTWQNNLVNSTFTDNPLVTTAYSFTGATAGCSTAATTSIVLKSVPVPTVTNNSPLCAANILSLSALGGLSYSWVGAPAFNSSLQNPTVTLLSIANGGAYQVTVTAANNCTALAITNVTVYALPTLTVSGSTVCVGQSISLNANSSATNFVWSGPLSFTSSAQNPVIANAALPLLGTYSVIAMSTDNCISTETVGVIVVPPPSLTVALSSNSMCAQALNGSPNTITLTSSGANTYTLSTPNHIVNSNPSGPSSPLNMAPPYQPTGPATATLLGSNGVCTVSITTDFTITPNPTVSVSNPTPVICVGQSYTYTSNGASSYTWGGNNPGSFIYTTGSVAVSNPTINSVFSVFGGSLGCNSALQTSTMTVNPLPTFSVSGSQICPGTSALLTASGTATSYSWSPATGLNATTGFTVAASPSTNQSYLIVGSLNNCTVSAQALVSLFPLPAPSVVSSKNELCLYDQLSLSGAGGIIYEWFGPGNVYLNGQQVNFTATNINQSGNFTLTVTDGNGCKNSTNTTIQVTQLPGAIVSGALEGCVPLCTDLAISSSVSAVWSVYQQSVTGSNFNYCFKAPGSYSVYARLYDAVSTCSNTLIYPVTVYPQPIANFEFYPEHPVEALDEVRFMNTSGNSSSSNWYFINNKGYKANTENVSYLFENAGTYPVALVVTNSFGCPDSIVKTITVDSDFSIYVPSAFTPNEDGKNEIFLPVGHGIGEYELMIFDRWGEKLFTSTELAKGWDGFYKGEPAKSDVYVWKISIKARDGKTKDLNGHVTLYR